MAKATMGKFPNTLLARMTERGISQADLTRTLNENKQTIWKLVHGQTRLDDVWAKKLAPIFEVPWHDLIETSARDPVTPFEKAASQIPFRANTIGARIEAVRALNWFEGGPEAAAEQLNIPVEELDAIEQDQKPMDVDLLLRFCSLTRCTVQYITEGSPDGLYWKVSAWLGMIAPHLILDESTRLVVARKGRKLGLFSSKRSFRNEVALMIK
jgi:transcriptional regulator with XRE-family HTH domain